VKGALDFCYNNPIAAVAAVVVIGLVYYYVGGFQVSAASLNPSFSNLDAIINRLQAEMAVLRGTSTADTAYLNAMIEQLQTELEGIQEITSLEVASLTEIIDRFRLDFADLHDSVGEMEEKVEAFISLFSDRTRDLIAIIGTQNLAIEKLNSQVTGMYLVYSNIFSKFQIFAKVSFTDSSGAMSAHGRALLNALTNHSDSFFLRNKTVFGDLLVPNGGQIKEELVSRWLGYLVTPTGETMAISHRFNPLSLASSSSNSVIFKQGFEHADQSFYFLFCCALILLFVCSFILFIKYLNPTFKILFAQTLLSIVARVVSILNFQKTFCSLFVLSTNSVFL